jgi:hypothetical protein
LKKSLLKKSEGGEGGWRIVIPMPEAINFVDGRRQKLYVAERALDGIINSCHIVG